MYRSRGGAALVLAATLGLGAMEANAGEAQDRLFETGVLDSVETGQALMFRHERTGAVAVAPTLPPIADGQVEVLLVADEAGGRDARVTLREGPRARTLEPFPATAGNPLLMVFMETSVRSMAAAAGGSPFYIRNRMREALRTQGEGETVRIQIDGAPAEGRRWSFHPFDGDPNASRMGPFAALEIAFVLSDAAPGRFVSMEAVSGPDASGAPAFRESFVYQGLEGDG